MWSTIRWLALLVLLVVLYRGWRAWQRADALTDFRAAELEAVQDSLELRSRSLARLRRSVRVRDSTAQQTIDSLRSMADRHAEAAEEQRKRATELEGVVRGIIPPDAVPAFDDLLTSHRRRVDALLAQVATLTAERDSLVAQRDDARRLAREERRFNEEFRAAYAKMTADRDFWRRKANPPITVRALRELPKLAVYGGLGLLAGLALSR